MAESTKNMTVGAGSASASVTATVTDQMPGVPCPATPGYTYTGMRYVPVFADPAEWSSANSYEPLEIVIHEGNSYTSKTFVPVGVEIANKKYWANTGNYNAQIEQYRQEVQRLSNNFITPEIYGAKGDGITDDTQAFINAFMNVDTLYLLPKKTYKIANVSMNKKQLIGLSYINDYDETFVPSIITDSLALNVTDSKLVNINFKAKIGINSLIDSIIDCCTFQNMDVGVNGGRATSIVKNCHFLNCAVGIQEFVDSKITACNFNKCKTAIYFGKGFNDNIITDCKIEWNDTGILIYQANNNIVNSNVFDRNAMAAIKCIDADNSMLSNNLFRRNGIGSDDSNNAQLHVENSSMLISYNTFKKGHKEDDATSDIVPQYCVYATGEKTKFVGNVLSDGYTIDAFYFNSDLCGCNNTGADVAHFGEIITKSNLALTSNNKIAFSLKSYSPGMFALLISEYNGTKALCYTAYVHIISKSYINISGVPTDSNIVVNCSKNNTTGYYDVTIKGKNETSTQTIVRVMN